MSETVDADSMTEVDEPGPAMETRAAHPAVARVLTLSVFFLGIGIYAVAGFAIRRADLFAVYRSTYFAVGTVVGVIGVLLWLVTR